MLISQMVSCPYCGAPNEIEIDPSGGKRQDYEEDCQVCCRPWQVRVRIGGSGEARVHLHVEDDTHTED